MQLNSSDFKDFVRQLVKDAIFFTICLTGNSLSLSRKGNPSAFVKGNKIITVSRLLEWVSTEATSPTPHFQERILISTLCFVHSKFNDMIIQAFFYFAEVQQSITRDKKHATESRTKVCVDACAKFRPFLRRLTPD